MIRKPSFFGVAVIWALVLSAAVAPVRAADAPYDIDVILSLSGQGAFIGKSNQQMFDAFETALNKRGGINGHPIHFVYLDDQTAPQVAVQLANAIIAKGSPVFLGPTITATCRAVAPLVLKGPVQYCLSPGLIPQKNSFTYSVSVSADDMIGVALRYFRERGWHRIARLTTTDATGQQADGAFAKWLALPGNKDLTVVADERFSVTDLSTTAQVSRIKSAQPQVVVVWATGTPLGTALRGFNEVGVDAPLYVSNSNMTTVQGQQYASIIPKEYYSAAPGYVAGIAPPASSAVLRDYLSSLSAAGLPNDYTTGISWDAALIVSKALESLGPKPTADQIRAFIQQQSKFPGIAGTYNFTDASQRGLGPEALMVMRYDVPSAKWSSVSGFGGMLKR